MNHVLANALLLVAAAVTARAIQRAAPKAWDLRTPAPVADGRPKELDAWKEMSCARCHEEIAREWASTTHALAWIDPSFQEQLADMKRPESCYGCHIPVPLEAVAGGKLPQKPNARPVESRSTEPRPASAPTEPGGQPMADSRSRDAHFGVTCLACHLSGEATILGPFGAPTEAHASKKSAAFLDEGRSELCIACHATNVGPVVGIAKDFADSDQLSKKKSCVGCHMQPIERAIANPPADARAELRATALVPRKGRSHALQTPRDPAFLARAFVLRARAKDGSVIVTIANECGHRVPGLIGRKITFEAQIVAAAGAPGEKGENGAAQGTKVKLELDTKSPLAVDGTLEIALAGSGLRVKVLGRHDSPGFEEPVTFLDRTIDVER